MVVTAATEGATVVCGVNVGAPVLETGDKEGAAVVESEEGGFEVGGVGGLVEADGDVVRTVGAFVVAATGALVGAVCACGLIENFL